MNPHLQLLCFLLWVNHSLCFPKNRKMWNSLDMAIGNLPNIVDVYSGERSLGKMGWPEINSLVKAILNQLEVAQDNMMELKDDFEDHSVGFISTIVILGFLSIFAMVLICLNSVRLRKLFGRVKNGLPPSLDGVRRNLQEFIKIRKMSVGELTHPPAPNSQGFGQPNLFYGNGNLLPPGYAYNLSHGAPNGSQVPNAPPQSG